MQNSERAVSVTVDEFITTVCACDYVHVCACVYEVHVCVCFDVHICMHACVFCVRSSESISLFPSVY